MMGFERARAGIGSIAIAAAVAVVGWAGTASAAACLEDASGDTNCTANDFAVSSVTVLNVSNNDCGGPTNTFTFDGELNVGSGSADRYDVGFYIGADSQALTGNECSVSVIPGGSGTVDDGDQCGDYDGVAVAVPVSNVTVTCNDGDGDGFFDLALCTAWHQNGNPNCTGPDDAVAGTSSKCDCATVNTDVEIPECASNAECGDDANVCTDAVCLGIGEPGADSFGCGQVNNSAPCDDALFCNGTDVCSAGSCGHSGNPCIGGGICGDNCNEAADNCFDAAGTTCRAANGVCDQAETCTGSSADCPANDFLDSGVCRAQNGICDVAESCNGSSANCPVDGFVNEGTVCRAADGECDIAEQCTGGNGACPADGFVANGDPCSTDGNVCTDDVCDGAGDCDHNPNTDPCDDGLFCTTGDACSAGACGGLPLDCSDSIECTDDSCNEGSNACVNAPNNGNCEDGDLCTADICSIQAAGCEFEFTCTTDICRSPGYWATHSGYEKLPKSINVAQLVLDAAGPLEVCGQMISATSNGGIPYVDGLGLSSDLEGLCMRARGVPQRRLYRHLTAAALNCAISGGDCDAILGKYVDVSFTECSDLCAGNPAPDAPSLGECVENLDCFNNGGQMIDGSCVEDLPGNCHETPLCNEGLGVCPKSTPASSPKACQEARFNNCTIDSCN